MAAPAAARHQRRVRAVAINAAAKPAATQSGGAGIRQFGSMEACQATTCCDRCSSQPADRASHPQPVAIARKPTGRANPISGTTMALAEKPERPTR